MLLLPKVPEATTPYSNWDEPALVRALAEGDSVAFTEIYKRYWFPLLQHAYQKLNSREEAEEVVQELLAALWHKRATLDIQHLRRYLYTAVTNHVLDRIKAQIVRRQYAAQNRPLAPMTVSSTEDELAAADLTQALAASVAKLPDHTREVFRLSRFEYRSADEIAQRLHLSQKTVEYHLTRALKLLRVSLKDFLTVLVLWLLVR